MSCLIWGGWSWQRSCQCWGPPRSSYTKFHQMEPLPEKIPGLAFPYPASIDIFQEITKRELSGDSNSSLYSHIVTPWALRAVPKAAFKLEQCQVSQRCACLFPCRSGQCVPGCTLELRDSFWLTRHKETAQTKEKHRQLRKFNLPSQLLKKKESYLLHRIYI